MKCKDCPLRKWKKCREKYPDYRDIPGTYCEAVKNFVFYERKTEKELQAIQSEIDQDRIRSVLPCHK